MYDLIFVIILWAYGITVLGALYFAWVMELTIRDNEKRWGIWKKEIGSWYKEDE